jgi:phospholipid/cholesterol/gamma-HCH transport system ATP-binding protein
MTTTPAATEHLLQLQQVSFAYSSGQRLILDRLSLNVPRGKVTALMGASGGGKTTVLRLIGGQQRASSGQVLFDGQDVGTMDSAALYATRRRMGMLFQFGALFTDLSVYDNVAFALREHTELDEALIRDIVLMKLDAVGLRGARDLMPAQISGGMAMFIVDQFEMIHIQNDHRIGRSMPFRPFVFFEAPFCHVAAIADTR